MSEQVPRVAVVQDGARLHYAVPAALLGQGMLERVFCDWYAAPWSLSRLFGHMVKVLQPAAGRRMLDRYSPDLAGAHIVSNPLLTLRVLRQRRRFTSVTAYHQWESEVKGRWMEHAGWGRSNALFGFIRNIDPELCARARQQGLVTVGDQMIAPYAVEREQWQRQAQAFPEFVTGPLPPDDDRWIDHERRTWDALDAITCASAYVRDGLIAQGIAAERIHVNPYPVDLRHFPAVERPPRTGPVTVGFVGRVNLRKGTPYFFQVARRFAPQKVKFVMIGPVDIAPAAVEKQRGAVELAGPVARSEIPAWLSRFDIFLFPSTCEGSAGAGSEAMATGLPVICSPNSGAAIRDGSDGFLRPYHDVDALAACVEQLVASPQLRREIGARAAQAAREWSIQRFSAALGQIIRGVLTRKAGGNSA